MEKELRVELGLEDADLTDSVFDATERLSESDLFRSIVVQRSRAYAVESQKREKGAAAVFPDREAPRVAEYSVRKTYGNLLDMIEAAFSKKKPLFALPFYYPLAYYKGA